MRRNQRAAMVPPPEKKREVDGDVRYHRHCDQAARPGALDRAVARLSRLLRDRAGAGDVRAHLAKADRRGKPDPRAWRLGAADAPLVGITHYLLHAHAWMAREVCYLQDLFVDASVRRRGCGVRLIEAVAALARERGCARLYWTTKQDNATARSLYDRIARFNGFIRYDYAID